MLPALWYPLLRHFHHLCRHLPPGKCSLCLYIFRRS
ncbi:hypothetical protein BACCAP_02368 [Pseudoflavonifractor capillosus ATCC 29799]|uniref:Uncharacterized protein n=1 Tax=Pseudoflavonifractor capillosus ATCC 29799 TaxID=411467 RepID=A6NVX5_9FIRM|nr:hypothetical protein BACCAP_02368 [Pseudoflavonifractor capillosus ATCC 29799]